MVMVIMELDIVCVSFIKEFFKKCWKVVAQKFDSYLFHPGKPGYTAHPGQDIS